MQALHNTRRSQKSTLDIIMMTMNISIMEASLITVAWGDLISNIEVGAIASEVIHLANLTIIVLIQILEEQSAGLLAKQIEARAKAVAQARNQKKT